MHRPHRFLTVFPASAFPSRLFRGQRQARGDCLACPIGYWVVLSALIRIPSESVLGTDAVRSEQLQPILHGILFHRMR